MLTPFFTITNRITAGLTQIERARGFLEAARLSEYWVQNMQSRAFLLEAHHTTHIEGTRLTPRAVEKHIAILKTAGRLKRVGPARGGWWEVVHEDE